MAKFCGNCGAQLSDDAKVCGQCGTPIDGNQGKISGLKDVDPKKKKNIAKKIKAAVVLLIVIVVVIAGIRIALNFTGTNGLVKKVMVAYKKYDIETLVALSSDVYRSGDYDDYVEDYFENAVGRNIDSFESSVGHSYKMTYEVDEIYELSQRKKDELMKDIEYYFSDFDLDLIGKVAVANVNITAKQGSKSANKDIQITMVKEGSVWKLLYIE